MSTAPHRAGQEPAEPVARPILKASPTQSDDTTILISLAAIHPGIPPELFRKPNPPGLDRHRLALSKQHAIEQLPTGRVSVTLEQLKKSVPSELFVDDPAKNSTLIPLPLKEIIDHVPPTAFSKRRDQKQIAVPDTIQDLFGIKGETGGLRLLGKNELAPTPNTPAPPPKPNQAIPDSPVPAAISSPDAAPSSMASLPDSEFPQIKPKKPISMPAAPQPQAPGTAQVTIAPDETTTERLRVPLEELLSSWPQEIQAEAAALQITGSVCALPLAPVKEGLRGGGVRFHWKTLRNWIEPDAPANPSPHGEIILELSLRVLSNRIISNLSQHTAILRKAHAGAPAPTGQPTPPAFPAPAPLPNTAPALKLPDLNPLPAFKPDLSTTTPPESAPAPQTAPTPHTPDLNANLIPAPNLRTLQSSQPATAPSTQAAPQQPVAPGQALSVDMTAVMADWPEEVRNGISAAGGTDSKLEIPLVTIEAALKQGKVTYTWEQIAAWINPPLSENAVDGTLELTLPLQVIAPLYMAQRPNQDRKKLHDNIDIPDVFGQGDEKQVEDKQATPAPEPKPPAAEPAEPQAAPVAPSTTASNTTAPKLTAKSLPELFGEPKKKNWTPNEIVHHTTLLPEVDGALIALQDGLLVASAMPPNWKTETVAAFIPQIFGRMKQYSGEIAMGELTSISFTVEQGTFQVFNAGIIYFAALGQPTARLPIPELNLIALELSRHTK